MQEFGTDRYMKKIGRANPYTVHKYMNEPQSSSFHTPEHHQLGLIQELWLLSPYAREWALAATYCLFITPALRAQMVCLATVGLHAEQESEMRLRPETGGGAENLHGRSKITM